jgi:hypothetical protein
MLANRAAFARLLAGIFIFHTMVFRMHDLAKDGAQLALGLSPFAFIAEHGLTALAVSLLNVFVLAGIRLYDAPTLA